MVNGEVECTSHPLTLGLASGLDLAHGWQQAQGKGLRCAFVLALALCASATATTIASPGSCFLFSQMNPCGADLSPAHREEMSSAGTAA